MYCFKGTVNWPLFTKLVLEQQHVGRMKEACVLLAGTSLEVQAIGQEVGFTSGANFATAFKERFGVSPSQFRQTCLAKDVGEPA